LRPGEIRKKKKKKEQQRYKKQKERGKYGWEEENC